MITPLEDVISGREQRAAVQAAMLRSAGDEAPCPQDVFLCQITLNIPGYPKSLPDDSRYLLVCRGNFLMDCGISPAVEQLFRNGAGVCWIGAFMGGEECARSAKHCAVSIEESGGGRVFDIDIITRRGSLSRSALGLPERRCMLCGNAAKLCARERSHPFEELRAAAERFLNDF